MPSRMQHVVLADHDPRTAQLTGLYRYRLPSSSREGAFGQLVFGQKPTAPAARGTLAWPRRRRSRSARRAGATAARRVAAPASKAVAVGKPDVDQRRVGAQRLGGCERLRRPCAASPRDASPLPRRSAGASPRKPGVVVDDQHAAACTPSMLARATPAAR